MIGVGTVDIEVSLNCLQHVHFQDYQTAVSSVEVIEYFVQVKSFAVSDITSTSSANRLKFLH